MSWRQAAPDEVALTFELASPVWGYRTRWDRSDLLLDIRRPPAIDAGDPLRGRLIAVDPGHPPGGATGPTGLREAEANLGVALELQRLLRGGGRPRPHDADAPTAPWISGRGCAWPSTPTPTLLVSIHNNALPDGDQSVRQQRHQRLLQPAPQRRRWRGRSRPRCSRRLRPPGPRRRPGRPGAGARHLDALGAHGGAVHDAARPGGGAALAARGSGCTPRRWLDGLRRYLADERRRPLSRRRRCGPPRVEASPRANPARAAEPLPAAGRLPDGPHEDPADGRPRLPARARSRSR